MAQIKSKTISVGGKTKTVAIGSNADKKYSAQGATTISGSAGKTAKAGVSSRLKALNKPGSATYIPTPDDAGYENMDAINNEAVKAGLPKPITPQTINTGQPSPQNVNAGIGLPGAPTVPYDQALKGLQRDVKNPNDLGMATNALKQMYQGGFQQTMAGGTQAPATQGAANTQIQQTTQPTEQPPSPLTGIVETDTAFDSIFTAFDDFFSPPKQKQSLLQEYQSMEKSLGINKMNEELIDAKRIIEGTEDDIRSEVQAASGFATDSQVLALANARNKSLVKNYNYLLESRDSAMTQLNTMMNLSIQDRQMAEAEFDRKMNFAFKVAEFKERAVANAREGYNNTLKLMGADGMYNALVSSGDPSAMTLAERTLGIPSGGLAIAAQQAIKQRALEETKGSLELDVMRANIEQSKASAAASRASAAKTIAETSASKLDAKVNKGVETASTVLSKVKEATNLISGATTGFLGQIGSKVGGTKAFNLASAIDTIQANIGFDTLQAMRDASPTGGALGQVSEREIALLQSTVSSLKVGQSAETLAKNLEEVGTHYKNWLETVGYSVASNGDIVKMAQ